MRLGLRTRVAVNLGAAVSITFGFVALSLLGTLRSELRQGQREAAQVISDAARAMVDTCADDRCARDFLQSLGTQGIEARFEVDPICAPPCAKVVGSTQGPALEVVASTRHGVMVVRRPLGAAVAQATQTTVRTLVVLLLNALLLVLVGTWLLERGVVRRLASVQDSLQRIEKLDLDPMFLPEAGGDAIGRMGSTVRRVAEKLRADRLQTQAHIDELEQANRALSETRAGLARSERLATVGRLAAGVAHEIGNPVAAALAYLELLGKRPGADALLGRVETEVRRVDRIVRDLLDFARPQPMRVGAVAVDQAVDSALRLVTPQPRWRQMQVRVAVDEGLPAVRADEHHLVQVLVNLLINAADACQGQGTVQVRAQLDGDAVTLEVADDGPGLAPGDTQRVFDPFFTTKPPGEGTGLGLSISHRIVEQFGGELKVRANEPSGAVFCIRLPVAA